MNYFNVTLQTTFICLLLALNLACAPSNNKKKDSGPTPDTSKRLECEILKKDESPRATVQYTSRDIERHFQRTIRLSCEGRVISDGLETVKSPWGKLNIYPQIKVPSSKTPGSWNIRNRQTCNGGGFRLLDNLGTGIRVWLDVARAAFTFEVVPGRNIIDYDFSICEDYDTHNKNQCLRTQYQEKGSVVLDIAYKELIYPGIREIKEACPLD